MRAEIVDVEGAVKAYLMAYPGLTGKGNPVTNGFALGARRSPASGVLGDLRVAARELSDVCDQSRVSIRLRSVGSEDGARAAAERAARAVAAAMLHLSEASVDVVTRYGDTVRLITAGNPGGPIESGQLGGESVYTVDIDVLAQNLDGTYGIGPYGQGTYGA